jgi:hypothetical protein
MNGQFLTSIIVSGEHSMPTWHTIRIRRMIFALSASCILHFIIFWLPSPFEFGKPFALPEAHTVSRPFSASMTVVNLASARTPPEKSVQQSRVSHELPSPAASQKPQPPQSTEPSDNQTDPVEDRYFTVDELSETPQVQGSLELDTPETRSIIAAGTIDLRLWINENGNVDRLVVEKTDLPEPIVALSIDTLMKSHFIPGQRDNQPVKSMISFEIVFDDDRISKD